MLTLWNDAAFRFRIVQIKSDGTKRLVSRHGKESAALKYLQRLRDDYAVLAYRFEMEPI